MSGEPNATRSGDKTPDKNKEPDPPKAPPKPKGPPWYKRPGIVLVVVLVGIALVVAIVLMWRHHETYITTDDAYIDVVSQQVSPQIAGRVLHVAVSDNEDVKAGQLLVEIDPADYQARFDSARAQEAQAEAQVKQAQAQVAVYEAQLEKAKADLGTSQANATNAKDELERYQRLRGVNPGAVSGQQMDSATAAATSTAAELKAAQKSVEAARAQQGYAQSQVVAARAAVASAASSVHEAELTLSYTRVLARIDGRVTSKTVQEGNVVSPGTALMSIVPRDVYVTANFKETQLQNMRLNQPVTIKVDAYPDMKLAGKVNGVQAATGEALTLIPAENATGNWVKIVQRVPVKIVFDQIPDDPQRRLGPGMSVEVSVDRR